MANDFVFLLTLCLSLVAFFYASVGHGGASGYLAVFGLLGVAALSARPFVLLLNFFVAAAGFFQFYRAGFFRWHLFWPFALLSVPCTFLGAMIRPGETFYEKLVASVLIFSALHLAFFAKLKDPKNQVFIFSNQQKLLGVCMGAMLGFLSGIVGVGGGVFLSPLLLLLGWAGLQETAAVSGLFIVVNSLSGLSGLVYNGTFQLEAWVLPAFPVVWIFGYLGSAWGSRLVNQRILRSLIAGVLFFASIILLIR